MCFVSILLCFFFYGCGDHLDLHLLTHSFPTRRSSELGLDQLRIAEQFLVGDPARGHRMVAGDQRVQLFGQRLLVGDAVGHVEIEPRSEEHTSELQSLMRISYAVFCLKKKKQRNKYDKPELDSNINNIQHRQLVNDCNKTKL